MVVGTDLYDERKIRQDIAESRVAPVHEGWAIKEGEPSAKTGESKEGSRFRWDECERVRSIRKEQKLSYFPRREGEIDTIYKLELRLVVPVLFPAFDHASILVVECPRDIDSITL